ncbi:MFS transporter [Dietzia maris]
MRRGPGPTAWVIWGLAVSAYAIGAFHRSSLAVAGLHAADRFDLPATGLAIFVVLQLAVYAILQVPVGLLVDRFGARRVLLLGLVAMSLGQVAFGLTGSYAVALVARVLVGVGDATTFVCVLRLINSWFPPRSVPAMVQLTGPLGQVGTIAAAVPMTWALGRFGWESAYLTVAGLGLVVAGLVVIAVRDDPEARTLTGETMNLAAMRTSLKLSWAEPGTRLGFWIHFSQHFSASLLGLLWGFPFFVRSEGTSEATAGLLLTAMVVAVIVAAPVLGWFVTRHSRWRSELALASIAAVTGAWTGVLLWPGHAPVGLLLLLVVVVGAAGPVAMIGFDYARLANPPERLASAIGMVNQGGFLASLTIVLVVGVLLDLGSASSSDGTYAPGAFAPALSAQFALWAVAAVQIWRLRTQVLSECRP